MVAHTWNDAVDRWLSVKSTKRSILSDQSNFRWLGKYLSGFPLEKIDRNVVEVLISKKAACGVRNATINRMLSLLRAVLNAATNEWGWLSVSPKIKLLSEPRRRIRFLTLAQAERLLAELPPHLSDMAAFSLATGLRRSNVTGLTWDHVDFKRRFVVFPADQMKSGQPHAIPLNNDALKILLLRRGANSQYVFSYKGRRIQQASTAAWYKALKRCGIANFRWHDLRHTWASWHVQGGTPLLALQELGGWESAEMVRRYAHFSLSNLAAYTDNLPAMIRPR